MGKNTKDREQRDVDDADLPFDNNDVLDATLSEKALKKEARRAKNESTADEDQIIFMRKKEKKDKKKKERCYKHCMDLDEFKAMKKCARKNRRAIKKNNL